MSEPRIADPFSMTYKEIVRLSKQNQVLKRHLSPRNFIDLKHGSDLKSSISSADTPELLLVLTAMEDNREDYSSSTWSVIVQYSWLLTSGDKAMYLTTELLWGLWVESQNWCKELPKLQFAGSSFIKDVAIAGSDTTLEDPVQNRGLQGWTTTWPLLVKMVFNKKDITDGCS